MVSHAPDHFYMLQCRENRKIGDAKKNKAMLTFTVSQFLSFWGLFDLAPLLPVKDKSSRDISPKMFIGMNFLKD